MARKYTLNRRAERLDETRHRIVEAAVHLHGTIGPARTQVSAIAERAGVERATVYRHFPDQASLFAACSGHFLAEHPPPDDAWTRIADPEVKLRAGLAALYDYYAQNEHMIANVLRDAQAVAVGTGFLTLQRKSAAALATGWGLRGRRKAQLDAVLELAAEFHTWQVLVRRRGLTQQAAIDLAATLAACIRTGE